MLRATCLGWFTAAVVVLSAAAVRSQESFTPIVGWDQQLFPSYSLATATMRRADTEEGDDDDAEAPVLGEKHGVIGIEIEAPEDDTPITVTVDCPEIMESSTFEGTLDAGGTTYDVYPRIRYRYKSLVRNKQATPLAITFTVTVGDEEPEVHTETATLRSINDCPFALVGDDDKVTDVSYMFAAYVNEQHPFVDMLLREALDDGAVTSFTGYQTGEIADVYKQVYALWHALTERDVRYSSITKSVATSNKVYAQHVRLIDESINNGQANCVDGAVLFASLLRKIDIEPILVSLPHHCYVAFYLDKDHTKLVGLETTLIGEQLDGDARPLPKVESVVDDEWAQANSWRTFCAAIVVGTADLAENQEKFNKDDPDYQLVSIQAAREFGILPIAFDASSPFKARPTDE